MKKQIAYQGAEGSYSEEAARRFFGDDVKLVPREDFPDVFSAVLRGRCEAGLVPLENSVTGSVAQNYDLLSACGCFICGECLLPVHHVLLGLPGSRLQDVRQVYSHEQGFLQCGKFLSRHKKWLRVPYFNTAVSARFVAEQKDHTKAAIASPYAGEIYGLSVLSQDICDRAENFTRFAVVCAKQPAYLEPQGRNKATILFMLRHEPGTLARALLHLSGLNLTRIESRPAETNWEYRFYADLEGDLSGFDTVLCGLGAYCTSVRLLGIYPAARPC